MNIMTKRGNLDNIVTYESICDTKEDLANIPAQYATLGSIALVIKGEDDMLEAYMATSEGEWVPIMMNGGSSGGGSGCDCVHLVLEEHLVDDGNNTKVSNNSNKYELNYTMTEIIDAAQHGTVTFKAEAGGNWRIVTPEVYYYENTYTVKVDTLTWTCTSLDDYPYRTEGGTK